MIWLLILLFLLYGLYIFCFILFQRFFVFKPARLKSDYRFQHDKEFKEVFFETKDGISVHALHVMPELKKGMVIYFHGNMKHIGNYLPYIHKFTDYGWSVLMMDYRGYGKSAGKLSEQYFFQDTQLAYDYAEKIFPESGIIIYGRSLGTAAATWLAAHNDCRQLVLESPYYNMYDLAWHYGMPLPQGNYLRFGLRTDQLIDRVKSPIIILHGTKDRTVPLRSAKKLKAHLKPEDSFIVINGAGHRNMETFDAFHEALDQIMNS